MVYAMNLGLGIEREDSAGAVTGHVVMSHMRYAERRMETATSQPWFAERGRTTSYVGRDGVGAHFEAGDAFAFGDALVVGYGPRTEELALKHLATDLGVRVRGFRITHPGMYHLDLAFCPLDETRAIVCPAAFDDASAAALMELVPEPLVLTEEEALTTFAANSIVIGRTVVMPACPDRVRAPARGLGLRGRAGRRVGVPQGRRLDPLPDQPGRRTHRSRPARRRRRRGRRPACGLSDRTPVDSLGGVFPVGGVGVMLLGAVLAMVACGALAAAARAPAWAGWRRSRSPGSCGAWSSSGWSP